MHRQLIVTDLLINAAGFSTQKAIFFSKLPAVLVQRIGNTTEIVEHIYEQCLSVRCVACVRGWEKVRGFWGMCRVWCDGVEVRGAWRCSG